MTGKDVLTFLSPKQEDNKKIKRKKVVLIMMIFFVGQAYT
jgi:hypothetical protein